MPRPDEGLIHTWLDGECTPEEAARVERLVATDPEWAAAVAEARGFMAASSRIVSALDSVPAAMPAGSRAAPPAAPRREFRVPRWMGLAAALVLVAGTAFVLRDRASAPFAPAVTTEPVTPAATDAGDSTPTPASASADVAPPPPPPTASPERFAAAAGSAAGGRAEEQLATPAPSAAAKASAEAAAERELRLSRSALRQAAAPAPPAAAPLADAAGAVLDGCWRVSAPAEAVGLLRYPQILAQRGDSLLLRTMRDSVWVRREADRLQGALEAQREPCDPASP